MIDDPALIEVGPLVSKRRLGLVVHERVERLPAPQDRRAGVGREAGKLRGVFLPQLTIENQKLID